MEEYRRTLELKEPWHRSQRHNATRRLWPLEQDDPCKDDDHFTWEYLTVVNRWGRYQFRFLGRLSKHFDTEQEAIVAADKAVCAYDKLGPVVTDKLLKHLDNIMGTNEVRCRPEI